MILIKCLGLESKNKLISYGRLIIENDNICIYKNITTTRINLDYLKKNKYNYDELTNIERNCLIFVENDKEILKKYGNFKISEGVVKMLEVIEINGKYYPKFDQEEWEESLRQEIKERGLKEGKEEGIKEGIKEGELNKTKEVALKLKNKNFSYKDIHEITGLDFNDIKML